MLGLPCGYSYTMTSQELGYMDIGIHSYTMISQELGGITSLMSEKG